MGDIAQDLVGKLDTVNKDMMNYDFTDIFEVKFYDFYAAVY